MHHENVQPQKFFIPNMSDHTLALAGVLRGMGVDAHVLPKPSNASMAIGLSLCRGRECLPCFVVTGAMILTCRQRADKLDQTVFVVPRGPGPCRLGQYNVLQKQILAEEGFPGVKVVSPTSSDSYALFGDNPLTLRKRAFQGVVVIDLLTKVLHEHRPYEAEPGSADVLYQECLDRVVEAGEAGAGKHFIEALAWTADRFARLPVDRSEGRPLIGVIGELYLLLNKRANLEVVRAVERAGGEVLQGTFMDYLHYVDWKRKKLAWLFGEYTNFLKGVLTDRYQKKWAGRLLEPLKPVLRHGAETPVREVMKDLQPHYETTLGTEAVLTMARALDVYTHGVAGFINVLPFSCMPGTIVAAMAPVLREKMDGIPWLDIAYDGQEETNVHTRLEAFMHQSLQFHRRVVVPHKAGDRRKKRGWNGVKRADGDQAESGMPEAPEELLAQI